MNELPVFAQIEIAYIVCSAIVLTLLNITNTKESHNDTR